MLPVLLLATPQMMNAQDALPEPAVSRDYLVENWLADEGLPRDTISSIVQDKTGYLWLATPPFGMIRFDGLRFASFGQEVSTALTQGEVWQALSDRDSGLWLTSRRTGLLRLLNGEVRSYGWDSVREPVALDSIAQDKDGIIWAVTDKGKLGKLVGEKLVDVADLSGFTKGPMLFTLKTDAQGDLWFHKQDTYGQIKGGVATNVIKISGSVINLTASHDGGMWLSTGNDLRHLLPGQTRAEPLVRLPFATNDAYGVATICEDRKGTLWIGTLRQGLLRWANGQLKKIEGVHHVIQAITEDQEGNLWVGTTGAGLFKLKPRVFRLTGVREGLPEVMVVSVGEDWIVPRVGGPQKILADGSLEKLAGVSEGMISVLPDSTGGVWFGTTDSRVIHFTKDGQHHVLPTSPVPHRQARILFSDHQGNLWIGSWPGGLSLLPVENPQKYRNLEPQKFGGAAITAIAENKAGVVWVGTSLGEIFRWDGGEAATRGVTNGLPASPIGALMFSQDDTLWVGTLGGGLFRLRKGQGKFEPLKTVLPDNVISQLIEDDYGWLWVGASRGLIRMLRSEVDQYMAGRLKSLAAVHYGRADGLEHVQCPAGYQPSVWKTAAGELRFATSRGLVTVNPGLLPVNQQPPTLVLEQVLVDGIKATNLAKLQLPHDYKRIQFCYSALSFTSPDKVHCRWKLSGYDEAWNEDGQERMATYPRLTPGYHQFRFTACNNDGLWNEHPMFQDFEVIPAYWQTGWFRAGAGLLLLGLILSMARAIEMVRIRRRIQRLEAAHALDRERIRIARDLHDDLGARLTQMAFATDIAARGLGDPVATKAQLREVSDQARQATSALDETVWMVDPRKDTLPQLAGYISQYANNVFRRTPIRCRQQICVHPPDYPLEGELRHQLFSAIKEAFTNVLKHSGATEVWLRVAVRGRRLFILIRDNGTGFPLPAAESARHGIENMRSRLEMVGGICVVQSKPGRGTRVLLRVSLPSESRRLAKK